MSQAWQTAIALHLSDSPLLFTQIHILGCGKSHTLKLTVATWLYSRRPSIQVQLHCARMRSALASLLLALCLVAAATSLASAARELRTDKVARMEFVSCPGCRLNRLPELKRFLREVIEVGEYPGVTVNFVPGRAPELYLYDKDNKEIEKMFVDHLSFAELHTLIQTKGFRPKSAGGTA